MPIPADPGRFRSPDAPKRRPEKADETSRLICRYEERRTGIRCCTGFRWRPVSMSASDIHDDEALRAAAARLVAGGDVQVSADGQIRPDRVDAARKNADAGAYNRRDVIAGIVDRLLEQWHL